jgi:hypothetical protein
VVEVYKAVLQRADVRAKWQHEGHHLLTCESQYNSDLLGLPLVAACACRNLFDYDQVVNTQRDRVYAERRRALLSDKLAPAMIEYAERTCDDILEVSPSSAVVCAVVCQDAAACCCMKYMWRQSSTFVVAGSAHEYILAR